jgi:hypothetical protein
MTKFSRFKILLYSTGIAVGLVVLLFAISGGRTCLPLLPGAYLASQFGYGAHDFQGLFLYIFGNMVFYIFVCFVILWTAAKVRQEVSG